MLTGWPRVPPPPNCIADALVRQIALRERALGLCPDGEARRRARRRTQRRAPGLSSRSRTPPVADLAHGTVSRRRGGAVAHDGPGHRRAADRLAGLRHLVGAELCRGRRLGHRAHGARPRPARPSHWATWGSTPGCSSCAMDDSRARGVECCFSEKPQWISWGEDEPRGHTLIASSTAVLLLAAIGLLAGLRSTSRWQARHRDPHLWIAGVTPALAALSCPRDSCAHSGAAKSGSTSSPRCRLPCARSSARRSRRGWLAGRDVFRRHLPRKDCQGRAARDARRAPRARRTRTTPRARGDP